MMNDLYQNITAIAHKTSYYYPEWETFGICHRDDKDKMVKSFINNFDDPYYKLIPLLNNECYEITINDTYGDGILSPGGYSLTDAAGTIIIQEVAPSFGYQAIEVFSKSTTTLINEITQEKINDNKIYDLLGRELKEVPVGSMYIRNQKLYIIK